MNNKFTLKEPVFTETRIGSNSNPTITGFITGDELKELISQCMENYDEKNIHACSYDLRNLRLRRAPTSHIHELKHGTDYKLYSGISTLVFSEETINIPLDVIVVLKLRNYGILEGLSLSAPIYVPGHNTRLCARVRNDGPTYFEISYGEPILQAFFIKLSKKAPAYDGKYQNNIK